VQFGDLRGETTLPPRGVAILATLDGGAVWIRPGTTSRQVGHSGSSARLVGRAGCLLARAPHAVTLWLPVSKSGVVGAALRRFPGARLVYRSRRYSTVGSQQRPTRSRDVAVFSRTSSTILREGRGSGVTGLTDRSSEGAALTRRSATLTDPPFGAPRSSRVMASSGARVRLGSRSPEGRESAVRYYSRRSPRLRALRSSVALKQASAFAEQFMAT